VDQTARYTFSDDVRGRIYRITYRGGSEATAANITACPSATAPPAIQWKPAAKPPEGTHPDAGVAALPVPQGATREMVALGQRIYRAKSAGSVHRLPR